MAHEELETKLSTAEEQNKKGNYNEAERLCKEVLSELPGALLLGGERGSDDGGISSNAGNLSPRQEARRAEEILRTRALLALCESLRRRGMANDALPYADEALARAIQAGDKLQTAQAMNSIAGVYLALSDNAQARLYLQQSLAINEELGNNQGISSNLSNLGSVSFFLSDYGTALEYYKKALAIDEEIGNKRGIVRNLTGIGVLHRKLSENHQALTYLNEALAINEEIGDKSGSATSLVNIGSVYSELSDFTQALMYMHKALAIDEELGRKHAIANNLVNIGNVYGQLAEYSQALEYYQRALEINEGIGSKSGIASNFGNIGSVYSLLSENDNALAYYQKALAINEEIGNQYSYGVNLGNIGSVYRDLGSYERAEKYFLQALRLCEEIGAEFPRLHWLTALGNLYAEQKYLSQDPTAAETYLKLAIEASTSLGVKHITRDASHSCYQLYKEQERWKEALEMKESQEALKDEIDVEEVKKQEAIRQQQKEIELAKAKADARHQATMSILHKTLPPTIADRLIAGEKDIADRFESVSILFADIVGFTPLAAQLSPREVVQILNNLFSRFDKLTEKYGVERIKTIGDAYMIVAGAPEVVADHALRLAQTAFGMLEETADFNAKSGYSITLRIGVSSGEAIAAVVGDVKFSYDLWSDAVNTASRMESHGEAGKIHCSEEFVRALSLSSFKSFPSFTFQERGEMHIKGKGLMKTYYLQKASL